MSEIRVRATGVIRALEDGVQLGEILLFPEVSVLGAKAARVRGVLSKHVRQILAEVALDALHQRREPAGAKLMELKVTLSPPRTKGREDQEQALPAEVWREPIELLFHAVTWRHGEQAHIAFVPALGIEVIAESAKQLPERLEEHVRFALGREGTAKSLWKLIQLQRVSGVQLETIEMDATIKSPKQIAVEAEKDEQPAKPVIEDVGTVLGKTTLAPAWELDETVARLADVITGRNPRSLLLVGKSGVGKSAAVRELVRRRGEFELSATPFWETGGARLVAGMSGFGMWQQRCQRLVREASKARAILSLGNLVELMEVGRSTHNAQGIASFLRPYLSRGDVLAICECTPEQLVMIERADPHLLEVFVAVKVEEPAPAATRKILKQFMGHEKRGSVDEEGLTTIDSLHRRYATYSAAPGRPLRFLRNLLLDCEGKTLRRREVIAAFTRETGLPLFLLDETVELDLDESRRWFTSRLIGQEQAIDVVIDLLATVKASLNRPHRPIASLMLIGPTGVGKTELSKLLAEFFFSDRGRLLRFDMSEYATPSAVERLVGGAQGGEGLLTSKIREQPFSVVLLDEFEKAHPALFDLMLQVLGEGRLTDAAGRVADFSNAIVLMTSNLGAQFFQAGPFGLAREAPKQVGEHFLEEVREFFRPELFNRIDRVIPFAALTQEQVLAIARREIELIRRRDGVLLRGMELRVAEDAVAHLARSGFDARYGARPLKRRIERELLAPLAQAANTYAEQARLVAEAEIDPAGELKVAVRAAVAESGKVLSASAGSAALAPIACDASNVRRRLQRLTASATAKSIENELYALRKLAESIEQRRRALHRLAGRKVQKIVLKRLAIRPEEESRLKRLEKLEPAAQGIAKLAAAAVAIEDRSLSSIYDDAPESPTAAAQMKAELGDLELEWRRLVLMLYALRYATPEKVMVVVYSEDAPTMYRLAGTYLQIARSRGVEVVVHKLLRPVEEVEEEKSPKTKKHGRDAHATKRTPDDRPRVEDEQAFLNEQAKDAVGIALLISGEYALPRFEPEAGLHVLAKEKKTVARALVEVTPVVVLKKYPIRFGLDLLEALEKTPRKRTYHLDLVESYDDMGRWEMKGRGQWESRLPEILEWQLGEVARRAVLEES